MQRLASAIAIAGPYPVATSAKVRRRSAGSAHGMGVFVFCVMRLAMQSLRRSGRDFRLTRQRELFLYAGRGQPRDQLAEVNEMAVELRAIPTPETLLARNRHSTTAAHAGAIDHHGVEAHDCLHAEGPRELAHCPHH